MAYFKKDDYGNVWYSYADLYKDFTKPVSSRRFSVSC